MIYRYTVGFSDIDFARVLFYGRFQYLVQQGSEHWQHQHGLFYRDLPDQDLAMPISAAFCRYLAPVRVEEVVLVRMGLKDLNARGFTFAYDMVKEEGGQRVAWGYLERRFVSSAERRPREAPEAVQAMLQAMAAESAQFVAEEWSPLLPDGRGPRVERPAG